MFLALRENYQARAERRDEQIETIGVVFTLLALYCFSLALDGAIQLLNCPVTTKSVGNGACIIPRLGSFNTFIECQCGGDRNERLIFPAFKEHSVVEEMRDSNLGCDVIRLHLRKLAFCKQ